MVECCGPKYQLTPRFVFRRRVLLDLRLLTRRLRFSLALARAASSGRRRFAVSLAAARAARSGRWRIARGVYGTIVAKNGYEADSIMNKNINQYREWLNVMDRNINSPRNSFSDEESASSSTVGMQLRPQGERRGVVAGETLP